jgi:biopolymer transport protein ExbD
MQRSPSPRCDPHAHFIHAPGSRLFRRVPLEFVWRRATGQRRPPRNPSLNLVSFIDFLVVTVIFLLMSFSASGECCKRPELELPSARNGEDVLDVPVVTVTRGQILVDGAFAGSIRAAAELGRAQKIDELFDILRNKRELFRQVQPNKPFPGACILAIDESIPASVVKSVFQTAAYAGYPSVSFLVKTLPSPP